MRESTDSVPDQNTRDVLLRRRGLVFAEPPQGESSDPNLVQAAILEWTQLGYVASTRLGEALRLLSVQQLTQLQRHVGNVLAEKVGSHVKHTPMFRRFPRGVPKDTHALWVKKVLCHYLQEPEQPCLFCRETGTTHVLSCAHVVCDLCFDGSNFSACPVCGQPPSEESPFFRPRSPRVLPKEPVRFELLDLGEDLEGAAQELFSSFCSRTQALSPNDRTDLETLVTDAGETALSWLPATVAVRENVALILGTLLRIAEPDRIAPRLRDYLKTATDVLRLIAAYSGQDPGLSPTAEPAAPTSRTRRLICRFPVGRLSRAMRRLLLELLDDMRFENLTEDMLRHRSFWVWIGEFLHPHEYAKRFPNVARAFRIVRKKAPDGTPAESFRGFHSAIEHAAARGDATRMTELLRARPGELARRLDHLLRVAGGNRDAVNVVQSAFSENLPSYSTPVLVTLLATLPTRAQRAKSRVYWPKGEVTTGVHAPDERSTLSPETIAATTDGIRSELLRRFATLPRFDDWVLDVELDRVVAPFNERTQSPTAVDLPRGSRVPIPDGKCLRLFLHWCEPEKGGKTTDLDLSVGFYGAEWEERGVCSYYQLEATGSTGQRIAASAGDLQAGPFPNGASEFVDVDLAAARQNGFRYAVMVVNSYCGMPFDSLERAFAGLMLREDLSGSHFDPRTVELKFALRGTHGVFMPLVVDLERNELHWLDVYARGQLQFNNVATSNRAIQTIGPSLMDYFASGTRMSMLELVTLHAAGRAERVYLRDDKGDVQRFERNPSETASSFYERLRTREGGTSVDRIALEKPACAALYRGDLELPEGSPCYALFRETTSANLSASDWIAAEAAR